MTSRQDDLEPKPEGPSHPRKWPIGHQHRGIFDFMTKRAFLCDAACCLVDSRASKLTRRDETAALTNFQTKAFLRFFPSSLDAIHMSHADDGDEAFAFAPK